MTTLKPRAFSSRPIIAAVMPLPRPDTTPPVTKICFAMPPHLVASGHVAVAGSSRGTPTVPDEGRPPAGPQRHSSGRRSVGRGSSRPSARRLAAGTPKHAVQARRGSIRRVVGSARYLRAVTSECPASPDVTSGSKYTKGRPADKKTAATDASDPTRRWGAGAARGRDGPPRRDPRRGSAPSEVAAAPVRAASERAGEAVKVAGLAAEHAHSARRAARRRRPQPTTARWCRPAGRPAW